MIEGPRSFARALEMIADGELIHDASAELQALLKRLRSEAEHRHQAVKGRLTLTLTLNVEPHGLVDIRPALTTKAADRKLARGTLWLTPHANLTPNNPRQQALPLREVQPPAAARELDDEPEVREL